MPHIILKLQSGRADAQKTTIAEALTQALVASAGCTQDAVSVSIEDIRGEDWVEARLSAMSPTMPARKSSP